MKLAYLCAGLGIAVVTIAVACSSARYPACDRNDECAVSGKHDYCVTGRCVYCRTGADCSDRERCRAGKCEVDPDAPPPRALDAGDDAQDADTEEAGTEDDEAPRESPRHILPRGVRRYLHP